MIRKIYRYIIRLVLFTALTILGIAIGTKTIGLETLGNELLKMGLWMLFILPLFPVITLFTQAIKKKDILLIITSLIIFGIILINIYYYGITNIPFKTS